ncbi:DoxX family protein [Oryzobacter terrae]|uniref:DoxX family protein n=1 Tax=Oryzobacter terrae TaxID=1620385 RepID=UPI00366DD4BB
MASVPPLSRDVAGLATILATSGVIHLLRPEVYEGIVPHVLPRKRLLVHASGIAEIACAAGLLHPATRRAAGWGSAALLVAVFPANVQMSVDHGRRAARRGDTPSRATFVATLARLPLQWPMVRTALRAAGR